MTKKSDAPAIRFKGFSDAWEQRKLGDIGKARSGVGFPDADQGGVTGVPFFKVSDMNLDGNENEMIVANNYVTTEQIAEHRWSPITELPAIFFAKVGAAVMLNRKRLCRFPFLLDNNTMAYSLSPTKWDADFAKALFGTVDLTSLVQVGALPSYNAGDVESMGIYLPSLFEQEQIGAFFKLLDNLITLHQRKFEKLTNVKKSMLEKMFPQNGSSYPEIRFKGFTDPWEQRKAKELFVSTADKGYPELPVLSATQDRGMIRRDENSINIFHDKKNEAGYKRVLPGQFVIHLRSFQGGFAHSAIEGITSPAYTVFGFSEPEKHNSEYWKYVFTSKSFIQRLETVTYGIRDGRSISYEEFLTLGFVYPSKAEQTEIARYLDKLSDLITLHQRELEKLQNIKKSMLEKMFV